MNEDFYKTGLSTKEVESRIKNNLINYIDEPKTKTIKEIIKSHTFTYFNFLNILLGSLVIISGIASNRLLYSLKNCLFVGVIFTNTIISIVQEILAKKTIDKLNVIADSKINVIRNSKIEELSREELVLDDVCIYSLGNQVVTDSIILDGSVEVNESFITGEEKVIVKKIGDELLSGSFIVSGKCTVKVNHIGKENYISKISSEAKYIKQTNSVIYNSFDKMLKILSFLLIPVGILFFINQLSITEYDIPSSIMSTVSALIGMIPEGLVLLTSSAMAVSVIRLRNYNILVNELYSIENLARVDTICLDKTGTITEGIMEVKEIIPYKNNDINETKEILGNYVNAMDDVSLTFKALSNYIEIKETYKVKNILYFSSSRKYSGVEFNEGVYFLGSPENLMNKTLKEIEKYQSDYRVLLLAEGKDSLEKTDNLKPLAFILIQDKIKENASVTLDYFKKEGVDIKIISGDNDLTVAKIADRAGIKNIKSVDMSKVSDEQIPSIIDKYNIFGRVRPEQKKKIICALKEKGHFVAMTGDGVNDCLALKEADCSIAMASGSEAAKNVSQFVLLDSKIDNLPKILKEGRRSINNIERSSSLLLSKTIFTIILIIACIYLATEYFFIPIHLTLITLFTISIPSFILALENNNELVKGNFLLKVFLRSLPSALTVVFNVVIIRLFEMNFNLDPDLCNTLTVFLTATTGFIFLNNICKPYNLLRGMLMTILLIGFGYCAIYQYEFFNISYINNETILIFIVLFICSLFIFDKLKTFTNYILKKTNNL
ncbi:MAG: HAD-IC family P-type ATPase [Bacilli bacterium]|nr:HAD-IC family P-type ATPase [Bacilli bacterium]